MISCMAEAAGAQVLEAVSAMVKALEPHVRRGWEVPAGQLEWSCQATAAHVAHDLAAYSAQLASGSLQRYLPFDLDIRAQATASDVLQGANAWGKVLAVVVEAADPEDRAWHFGPADRGAFAAMGIGEVLVHTHDIASGLGLDWRPPAELAELVVARLLPDAPEGDPVDVLLWATGRADLAGEAPAARWVWKAALK
jgi:hypothetical protein